MDDEEALTGGAFSFAFYEVLRVTGGDGLPSDTLVTVLGRSWDEDGTEWYAVTKSEGDATMMPGSWLTSTGRGLRREDLYDGTTVQVTAARRVADQG